MSKHTTSGIMSAAVSAVTFATAHAQQTVLTIPDNDSVYVDAKSFQVIPRKGKGDAGVQIKDLDIPKAMGVPTVADRIAQDVTGCGLFSCSGIGLGYIKSRQPPTLTNSPPAAGPRGGMHRTRWTKKKK